MEGSGEIGLLAASECQGCADSSIRALGQNSTLLTRSSSFICMLGVAEEAHEHDEVQEGRDSHSGSAGRGGCVPRRDSQGGSAGEEDVCYYSLIGTSWDGRQCCRAAVSAAACCWLRHRPPTNQRVGGYEIEVRREARAEMDMSAFPGQRLNEILQSAIETTCEGRCWKLARIVLDLVPFDGSDGLRFIASWRRSQVELLRQNVQNVPAGFQISVQFRALQVPYRVWGP